MEKKTQGNVLIRRGFVSLRCRATIRNSLKGKSLINWILEECIKLEIFDE
jgi:hypothetical protein